MVHHGLRGWSIAKHIWERTLPFLQSPQIDHRRKMAIFVPYETINGLFLAENSTEIFDDLVNMHTAFACQSSPHFLGCLVVGDRKPSPNRSCLAASSPEILQLKAYDPFFNPSTYLTSSLVGAEDRVRSIACLELACTNSR